MNYENRVRFNDFINIFEQVGPMFGLPDNFRNNINNLRDFNIQGENLENIFEVFRNLTRNNNINLKEIFLIVLMFTHKEKMVNFINDRQRNKEYHNLVNDNKIERKNLTEEKIICIRKKSNFY